MKLKTKAGIGGIGAIMITLILLSNYAVTDNTYFCENEPYKIIECTGISGGLHTRCYINENKTSWDFCKTGWEKVLDYVEYTNELGQFYEKDNKILFQGIELIVPNSTHDWKFVTKNNKRTGEVYPLIDNTSLVNYNSFTYIVSDLEKTINCTSQNQYAGNCQVASWNFDKLEEKMKSNVDIKYKEHVFKRIVPIYNESLMVSGNSFRELGALWYEIIFECPDGIKCITDLDPSATVTYSATSRGFFNQTEATANGVHFAGTNTTGDFSYFVYYNSTATYWNTTAWHNFSSDGVTLNTRTATSYNISDSNLIGFWSFNAGDATDDSSNSNNGAVTGAVFNENNGTVGKGAFFDGNDGITVTTQAISSTYSFSVWAYIPTGTSAQGHLIGGQGDSYGGRYEGFLGFSPTTGFQFYSHRNDVAIKTGTFDLGQWHHVAVSVDGTNKKIYLDGVLKENYTSANTALYDENRYFGRADYGDYLIGGLDEVRIYNRSLAETEIVNLYELGNYHLQWSAWKEQNESVSGTPQGSNNSDKFFQFKFDMAGDNEDYIFNHTVGIGSQWNPPDDNPYWTVLPSNISVYEKTAILENFTVTDDKGVSACWLNDTSMITANTTNYYNTSQTVIGTYAYNLTCNDTIGQTNSTFFTVEIKDSNVAPDDPSPVLISSDGTRFSNVSINCSSVLSDANGDDLNLTVSWYLDGVLNLTHNFYNIANNTDFSDNLTSGNLTTADVWICGMNLSDGAKTSNQVNSSSLTILDYVSRIQVWQIFNITSSTLTDVGWINIEGKYCNGITGVCSG